MFTCTVPLYLKKRQNEKKKKERMEKNILKERKIPLLSRNQCRYVHKTSLTLDTGIYRILKNRENIWET